MNKNKTAKKRQSFEIRYKPRVSKKKTRHGY